MTRRARRIPDAAGLQREAVLALGGLRAVLLELAHPAVGHGVAAHSGFADDPVGRLTGTLRFVYAVASVEPHLVAAVVGDVARLHRPVRSRAGDAIAYDARDPDLQRFVAATIHDSAVHFAERAWGPLPDALETELLARNGRIATVLGVPPGDWPATPAAFRTMFARDVDALAFDPVTARVALDLFAARAAPWWVRRALPLLVHLTAPTLPPGLASELGLRPDGVRSRTAAAVFAGLLPLYRALPGALRRLPARRVLSGLRVGAPA